MRVRVSGICVVIKMRLSNLILVISLSLLSTGAHAAHPLVSDDTRTQDSGNHQVEINTDQQRIAEEDAHFAAAAYTYGVRPELDLYTNLPVSLSAPSGRSDLALGAKWRFWEEGANALALKSELLVPTGDENKALGNGRAGLGMTLLASHETGPWFLMANLGLAMSRYRLPAADAENRHVTWRASAAAMLALTPKLSAVADTGIERNGEKAANEKPAFGVLGLIYSPNKDVDLDIGIKFGLKSAEGERQVGAGLTIRF